MPSQEEAANRITVNQELARQSDLYGKEADNRYVYYTVSDGGDEWILSETREALVRNSNVEGGYQLVRTGAVTRLPKTLYPTKAEAIEDAPKDFTQRRTHIPDTGFVNSAGDRQEVTIGQQTRAKLESIVRNDITGEYSMRYASPPEVVSMGSYTPPGKSDVLNRLPENAILESFNARTGEYTYSLPGKSIFDNQRFLPMSNKDLGLVYQEIGTGRIFQPTKTLKSGEIEMKEVITFPEMANRAVYGNVVLRFTQPTKEEKKGTYNELTEGWGGAAEPLLQKERLGVAEFLTTDYVTSAVWGGENKLFPSPNIMPTLRPDKTIMAIGSGAIVGVITIPETTLKFGESLYREPVKTIVSIPENMLRGISTPFGFGNIVGQAYVGGKVAEYIVPYSPVEINIGKVKIGGKVSPDAKTMIKEGTTISTSLYVRVGRNVQQIISYTPEGFKLGTTRFSAEYIKATFEPIFKSRSGYQPGNLLELKVAKANVIKFYPEAEQSIIKTSIALRSTTFGTKSAFIKGSLDDVLKEPLERHGLKPATIKNIQDFVKKEREIVIAGSAAQRAQMSGFSMRGIKDIDIYFKNAAERSKKLYDIIQRTEPRGKVVMDENLQFTTNKGHLFDIKDIEKDYSPGYPSSQAGYIGFGFKGEKYIRLSNKRLVSLSEQATRKLTSSLALRREGTKVPGGRIKDMVDQLSTEKVLIESRKKGIVSRFNRPRIAKAEALLNRLERLQIEKMLKAPKAEREEFFSLLKQSRPELYGKIKTEGLVKNIRIRNIRPEKQILYSRNPSTSRGPGSSRSAAAMTSYYRQISRSMSRASRYSISRSAGVSPSRSRMPSPSRMPSISRNISPSRFKVVSPSRMPSPSRSSSPSRSRRPSPYVYKSPSVYSPSPSSYKSPSPSYYSPPSPPRKVKILPSNLDDMVRRTMRRSGRIPGGSNKYIPSVRAIAENIKIRSGGRTTGVDVRGIIGGRRRRR